MYSHGQYKGFLKSDTFSKHNIPYLHLPVVHTHYFKYVCTELVIVTLICQYMYFERFTSNKYLTSILNYITQGQSV